MDDMIAENLARIAVSMEEVVKGLKRIEIKISEITYILAKPYSKDCPHCNEKNSVYQGRCSECLERIDE